MTISKYKIFLLAPALLLATACGKEFLELEPIGTQLESNFYKTEKQVFEGVVAVYDVLQWGGTNGWTMKLGLLNTASDDCHAGGSDASDQPAWVAWDNFTLDPNLGPQRGLWNKSYAGIYRANLILEKMDAANIEGLTAEKKARYVAEVKLLRAYFYFDLVRFFGNVPLIVKTLGADEIYKQTQSPPSVIYGQIEKDLKEAVAASQLPETVVPEELGRLTKGAARALLGKVLLFQNDNTKMAEAATVLESVITSNIYRLETNYANVFKPDNKFGVESVFEIVHSNVQRGGWENFNNFTEGNYSVQFFGIRDFVGATFASGWGFCPVSVDLATFMKDDPRFAHTIIDGKALRTQGASYSTGYQNTDFFIRKYAPLAAFKATVGESALNWGYNVKEIRFADVLLMAAEAFARSGNEGKARQYLNQVRSRVGLQPRSSTGATLLDDIATERRLELATEGVRYWDLLRTNKAVSVLGTQGFKTGKHEFLPIPQQEIDISQGAMKQNPGY
jgi:starch-binding outer membrane protein, SusD/RagB family